MDERYSARLEAAMSDAGRGGPRGGDPRAPGEPGRGAPMAGDPRAPAGDPRVPPGDPRAGDPRLAPGAARAPGIDPRGPMPEPPGGPPRGMPARSDPRAAGSSRGLLYARKPATWRRAAAVVVGVILLGLTGYWLDLPHALAVWLLFSLFVLLWPNFPPTTTGEERAQAWPFEP